MSNVCDHQPPFADLPSVLNLAKAVHQLPDFPRCDLVEEQLQHLFGTVWHAEQKITVLQAMAIYDAVSSTTAHRRLKSLRQKA
jgi:hypothetical protein